MNSKNAYPITESQTPESSINKVEAIYNKMLYLNEAIENLIEFANLIEGVENKETKESLKRPTTPSLSVVLDILPTQLNNQYNEILEQINRMKKMLY